MNVWARQVLIVSYGLIALIGGACRSSQLESAGPPPDVGRPQLKSEAELAADRREQIVGGRVIPQAAPVFAAERPVREAGSAARRPPIGAVQSDILIVNKTVITVDELLYALAKRIEEARRVQTQRGFAEQLERMIRARTQQEVGAALVYEVASADMNEQQREGLKRAVDREIDLRVTSDFAGSQAKFTAHLARYGLSLDTFRARMRRQIVVSSYTREMLMPQVSVRRDELLAYFRENEAAFSSPETRELIMIEVPFEKFLPTGTTWEAASTADQRRAKLKAVRHARAAHEALAERAFDDVVREYSRGVRAAQAGSWGPIGQPLQPPYDVVSAKIFEFETGQTSEPIETPIGWYIVKCGAISAARNGRFMDVQEEIREALTRERFDRLSVEYVLKLAERATISDFNAFVRTAVQRASNEDWPRKSY